MTSVDHAGKFLLGFGDIDPLLSHDEGLLDRNGTVEGRAAAVGDDKVIGPHLEPLVGEPADTISGCQLDHAQRFRRLFDRNGPRRRQAGLVRRH